MVKNVTPVKLPLGRLRLATRSDLTGSAPIVNTIGTVVVAAFSGDSRNATSTGNEDRRLARYEFGSKRGETIELTFGPTIVDRHVLAIDITGLGKTLPERRYHG